MQEFELEIIGTKLFLKIDTSSSLDDDFSILSRYLVDFESKYSRFIEGNWLSELNKNRSAPLDEDARNMLSFALELAEKTDGYFDPTIGSVLSRLGYGKKDELDNTRKNSYTDVRIEGDQVYLTNDVFLEFGGVGKGYLIDRIITQFERYPRFLINFGGDLYGKGGWKIGLEHPDHPEQAIGIINLHEFSLACSSGSRRKWGAHHHLIDPHTGSSAREVSGTYIEAKSGILTDGYATALAVMPYELACQTLDETEGIEGVILASDGRCFQSSESASELFGTEDGL